MDTPSETSKNSNIAWGSVADWVAAIGTSGALVWAVSAELRRQRRERDAPAHQVSAWTEWQLRVPDDPGPRPYAVYVRNSSEMPVYRTVVALSEPLTDDPLLIEMGIVAADKTDEYVLNEFQERFPPHGDPPEVDLFFHTTDGRLWHRNNAGDLRSMTALPIAIANALAERGDGDGDGSAPRLEREC